MIPSPFHGIFNFGSVLPAGRQDTPARARATGTQAIEIEDTPVAGTPAQQPAQTGQIAVDIYERDDYYIIRAPIAGIRLADLDIEVDGKILTIRGTRKPAEDIPGNQYYLQECFWGGFSRSITLPCPIDAKKVKATFSKDGILKVLIPKEEKVKIIRVSEG